MKTRVQKSIENFEKALMKLEDYLSTPSETEKEKSGVIQAFEFTFELSWKTFQKIADEEALESGGAKTAIKNAFKLNIIKAQEEDDWLDMLKSRNLLSHTYNENLAEIVFSKIETKFKDLLRASFERAKIKLQENK